MIHGSGGCVPFLTEFTPPLYLFLTNYILSQQNCGQYVTCYCTNLCKKLCNIPIPKGFTYTINIIVHLPYETKAGMFFVFIVFVDC